MPQRPPRSPDGGFTMVEVVLALALFGVLAGTASLSLSAALQQTRDVQNRTVATNIGQRVLDRLHAVRSSDLPLGQQPLERVRTNGITFDVSVAVTLVAEGAGATSACDGSGALSARRIRVAVTWPDSGSTRPVRTETVRRGSVAELQPTLGVVALKVVDRGNRPAAGHTVTLTPGPRTTTTTGDGCAVFPGLTPGTYAASLSTPGYVDRLGAAVPARTVTAVAGSVVRDPGFTYDRAASLGLAFTLAAPSTLAAYPPLPLLGASLGFSPFVGGARSYNVCGSGPCATQVAGGLHIGNLFPDTEGYRPWAGACTDARPGTLPASVVLAPGLLASAPLPLAPVDVVLQTSAGAPLLGGTVRVTHAPDGACTAVSALLTAPAGSNVVRLSLPGGAFSFQVGSGSAVPSTLTTGGPPAVVTVRS